MLSLRFICSFLLLLSVPLYATEFPWGFFARPSKPSLKDMDNAAYEKAKKAFKKDLRWPKTIVNAPYGEHKSILDSPRLCEYWYSRR